MHAVLCLPANFLKGPVVNAAVNVVVLATAMYSKQQQLS